MGMAAYIFGYIEVTDPAGYEQCKKRAAATITSHGGRCLTRGGATEVVEGDWVPNRAVIVEFPNMVQLKAWYDSPEYRALLQIRRRTSKSSFVAIEGL
jgi:uncharacterized protein (DUF1330 family)